MTNPVAFVETSRRTLPKRGRVANRRDHGAQRREQEERERDARDGEYRAPLVTAEIGENERKEFHRGIPAPRHRRTEGSAPRRCE